MSCGFHDCGYVLCNTSDGVSFDFQLWLRLCLSLRIRLRVNCTFEVELEFGFGVGSGVEEVRNQVRLIRGSRASGCAVLCCVVDVSVVEARRPFVESGDELLKIMRFGIAVLC